MSDTEEINATRQDKIDALIDVVRFNPKFTFFIIVLGMGAAVLEGVGLTFILPIIEIVQTSDPVAEADGLMEVFVTAYQTLGIPFTLGYVVLGVSVVMVLRYTSSFAVTWFREILRTNYIRDLQMRAFDSALEAKIEYFDTEGSDEILNAIITQTHYGAKAIKRMVTITQTMFLSVVYLTVAMLLAPVLTVGALVILGLLTVVMRGILDPSYRLGEVVAEANEKRQTAAQAGTKGIRSIRTYNLAEEMYQDFTEAVDQYTEATIKLRRNEVALSEYYNLAVAISIFVLIYAALTFANLSFGQLGLFLFAMFQLGPRVSKLNKQYYKLENDMPHLVRTQQFINELEGKREPEEVSREAPDEVERVEFDDVWFSYDGEETVLNGLSFELERGEFVAFVGQSGAGKSTIVSLLARFYEPDRGEIRANGEPIDEMPSDGWRERLAIVRQDPYIFNNTLRYNLTVGNRDASQDEIERACEIARVDEFLDDLPNGYDSQLGDEGVRLSGGQKQRVALARAILKDADILVLDEATSDLDTNLEKEVQQAIEKMDRDYAIITIAHRLSTVENADRIYTVKKGRVSEKGAHSDLIDNGGK
jgi:subfamily B ATP-binding cassette protein MsbA